MRTSLEKAFVVLEVIASAPEPIALKEIAARTGWNASTLSRVLADLAQLGYVRKQGYRAFALGLGLVPLGQKALSNFRLPRVANPLIHAEATRLGVQAALAGLHRERLVYLYRSQAESAASTLAQDVAFPLHASNIGVVLLAAAEPATAARLLRASLASTRAPRAAQQQALRFLEQRLAQCRTDGYSFLHERGVWNVCFPLRTPDGLFGVALHGAGRPPHTRDALVLACAMLCRRIEGQLRE
jgi:IclR family acetate operon transcriptional repressor